MASLFWYIAKAIVVSGFFYGYYFLVLKDRTFHTWNRFYLLGTVGLSLILPLISIELSFSSFQAETARVIRSVTLQDEIVITSNTSGKTLNTLQLITGGYLLVSALFLVIFLKRLFRILFIPRRFVQSRIAGIRFVNTNLPETPFSFLNTIYWNDTIDLDSPSGQNIFKHEVIHIRDKHSWDIIFMNIVTSVFWINPFFRIIKKELCTVHEFIADRKSVANGDRRSFAEMILSSVYSKEQFSITNNFFNSPIKRRLNMLNKNKHFRPGYLSRIMVFPLITFIFLIVSCNAKDEMKSEEGARFTPPVIVKDEPPSESPETSVALSDENNSSGDTTIYQRVEKEATFPGGPSEWQKYIVKAIQATVDSFTEKDYGTAVIKFIVDKDGSIRNVTAQTMQGTLLAKVSIDAIRKGPRWVPAMVNNKPVSAYRLQPVTLKNPGL